MIFYEKPANDYAGSGLSSTDILLRKLKDMVGEKGTAVEKEILERLTKLADGYRELTAEQKLNPGTHVIKAEVRYPDSASYFTRRLSARITII